MDRRFGAYALQTINTVQLLVASLSFGYILVFASMGNKKFDVKQ